MKLLPQIIYFIVTLPLAFFVMWYMQFVISYVPKEEMCMAETLRVLPCDTPPELRY